MEMDHRFFANGDHCAAADARGFSQILCDYNFTVLYLQPFSSDFSFAAAEYVGVIENVG